MSLSWVGCRFADSSHTKDERGLVSSATRLERHFVQSSPFGHFVFSKALCVESEPTFVFIEGDGRSWIRGGRVSEDPSPTRAIALELVEAEPSCALAVSRPCTFGLAASDPACEPAVWTLRRYSEDAIRSVVSVIEREVPSDRRIVVVGVSGGGLIAAHVAARVPRVAGLVTLGANLDLSAWLDRHGYTREILGYSPPLEFPLRPGLVVLHVVGEADEVVPPQLTAELVERNGDGVILSLPGADHTCCWGDSWPKIRDRFEHLSRELKNVHPPVGSGPGLP